MSARRQASTTSLAKYARGSDIGPHDRSVDFCNAFWGYADSGVNVLFARMRGAARTTDELRNFWKERAAIEDEYAKRLAKLAKQVLGRDEIGELRNSLDTIRTETERQAHYHLTLAQQVRGDLEAQTAAFHAKQTHHRKTYQSAIEKSFKAKQTQESYVAKAREKYETDCMCINSYTAQLGLVQGRDAERIHLKLERAQKTVVQNERDFANFARALGEGVERWEQEWRVFCDACQDLEEDRLEFTKDNMWAYANAVSTVCVSDDESCEKMRLALEQMEPAKDMEAFVRDYGTGNQIPDPPMFVNFSDPNAIPSSSSRPTFRDAEFARSSQRAAPLRRNSAQPEEDLEPAGEEVNMTGVGALRRGDDPSAPAAAAATVSRQNTQSRRAAEQQQQQAQQHQPQPRQQQHQPNGFATPSPTTTTNGDVARQPTTATRTSRSPSYRVPPRDPHAEPIDPNADTFIKVGPNAYRVDLARDPTATQQQGRPVSQNVTGGANRGASPQGGPSGNSSGNAMDPLARQMEELAMQSQGTIRRNSRSRSVRRGAGDGSAQQAQNQHAAPQHQTRPSSSMSMSLAAPHTQQQQQQQQRAPSPGRDYRYSADAVVGAHPSLSRPASPNPAPITAAFMRPASAASAAGVGRPGSEIIADVLTDYQQSLPGERKTVSRAGSRRGSYSSGVGVPAPGQGQGHAYNASGSSQASHGQSLARPTSQMGYAGIGSGSRSSSPQPQSMSRGPSPAPGPAPANANPNVRQSFIAPPPSASSSMNSRNGAASPNNLGIALDPSGRVIHDEMAQRYQQQQPPQQQQQRQSMAAPPSQGAYNQPQRRVSYMGPGTVTPAPPPPPPQQPAYGAMTPYQPQPGYVPPPPPLQQSYTPAPYQAPPPAQQQQQQVYQPQPHASAYQTVNGLQNGLQRGVSTGSGGYYSDGRQQQPQQHQQQQLVRVSPQQQQLVRAPQQQHLQLQPVHQAPVRRSPSPQPQQPTQTTSDGKWIMFYVKALFDYRATIDEEFDFQEGDIIAVTATPEDGWWSGELLDDGRRVPGKHIFPSNFVVLF